MIIESLQKSDYPQWLPLWEANCQNKIDQAVTNETWRRICDPAENVNGFAAKVDGELAGILHYILHPLTGFVEPACYMQDLYTAEGMRRKGIGRALVERLALEARTQKWARMYWLAENDNIAARNLYKTLGIKLDFTLHILPTG